MATLYAHSINRLIAANQAVVTARSMLRHDADPTTIGTVQGTLACAIIDINLVLQEVLRDIEVPIDDKPEEIEQ